jgi:site-specific recombinase XerD
LASGTQGGRVTPGRENGFHQLRHPFASTLLRDGAGIRALVDSLGHRDPGFTLSLYCHLMPGAGQDAGLVSP